MTKPTYRPAADRSAQTEADLHDKRVLIVDDNVDLCRSIAMFLEGQGLTTDPINQPTVAKERFKSGGYDLIILDIMMNGTDGFDLFRYLRDTVGDKETPVLFLSALVEPHHCHILNNGEPGNARVMSKSEISNRLIVEVGNLLS